MTLDACLAELKTRLRQIEEALENLLWAAAAGLSEGEEGHALVDHYDLTTNDLIGWVHEALESVEGLCITPGRPLPELAATASVLTKVQDHLGQLSNRFYNDIASFERIDALLTLGNEKEEEWAEWVQGVNDALSRCPESVYNLQIALIHCWQEIAEQTGLISLMTQAPSVSQQSSNPTEKLKDGN